MMSTAKMNTHDEDIWICIKKLADKCNRDLLHIDEEYKQQLIKGYKICKTKSYHFKSMDEEEQYFMRSDITSEEEVYYYEFIVEWSEKTTTLPDIKNA